MALLDGQYQYYHPNGRDILMGAGTRYQVVTVDGLLDLANVDTGQEKITNQDGYIRAKRTSLGDRRVTMAFAIYGNALGGGGDVENLRQAMMDATQESDIPGSLVFKRRGLPERELFCSVERVAVQGNYDAWTGFAQGGIDFHALDPVIYSHEQIATIDALNPTTGRGYDLEFPRIYGGVVTPTTTIINLGNRLAYPIIQIKGPTTGVLLRNLTTGQTIQLDIFVATGQVLQINMKTHAVTLNGENRRGTVLGNPQWWGLVPDENIIFYQSVIGSPAATLSIFYRSAWASA